MNLPRLTWDQARAANLWSADAFAAVGVKPATIRKRASRGPLEPAAIGPRGCKLYRYADVMGHADGAPVGDRCPDMSH